MTPNKIIYFKIEDILKDILSFKVETIQQISIPFTAFYVLFYLTLKDLTIAFGLCLLLFFLTYLILLNEKCQKKQSKPNP